jgi:Taurine catabolism dioxygenase TauD, TfdA family
MPTPPLRRLLSDTERQAIRELGLAVSKDYVERSLADLVCDLARVKLRLPNSLLSFFEEVKENRDAPGFILGEFPLSPDLERTPEAIPSGLNRLPPTRDDAAYLALIAGLGQPFTFDTIQNGNFVNYIVPIRENANKPISSGFTADFGLHTEDAFHPAAGDFLTLLCIRNRGVATTISFLGDYELSPESIEILSQPRFRVGNNIAHQVQMEFQKSPVLYGKGRNRVMRVNFNNTICAPEDAAAQGALNEIRRQAELNVQRVALEPGDVFIIDNMRTAHGREAYTPVFDGGDRWLKRLYVTTRWRHSSIYEILGEQFVVEGHAL